MRIKTNANIIQYHKQHTTELGKLQVQLYVELYDPNHLVLKDSMVLYRPVNSAKIRKEDTQELNKSTQIISTKNIGGGRPSYNQNTGPGTQINSLDSHVCVK